MCVYCIALWGASTTRRQEDTPASVVEQMPPIPCMHFQLTLVAPKDPQGEPLVPTSLTGVQLPMPASDLNVWQEVRDWYFRHVSESRSGLDLTDPDQSNTSGRRHLFSWIWPYVGPCSLRSLLCHRGPAGHT